jgi:hypothetical protein
VSSSGSSEQKTLTGQGVKVVAKEDAKQEADTQLYTLMEKRDEDQITRQLQGELVQDYFYSFKIGAREVVGLSWVGVKECARRMGHIKLDLISITEKEDEYQVVVKATDTLNSLEALGVSTQAKFLKPDVKDSFSLQKATSKATRNAIRNLLPEKTIATMLKRFREGVKK